MKKVKMLKKWGIYQLNEKEQKEYDFKYAIIDPDTMECYADTGLLTPHDTDWECNTLDEAIDWIKNY